MFEILPILKIILGLALIFVASKIVGFIARLTGIALIGYGCIQYFIFDKVHALEETVFPIAIGLVLALIGKGIAETVIKIIGIVVVIWGVLGLI